MPIFSYFAVVGSVLMALLFVADAKLPKQGPIAIGSQVVDLPGAQRPRMSMGSTLVSEPAPAPDMKSEAVRAAAPPATQVAQATQANAPQTAQQIAKADIAPVKKKRIARRPAAPQDEDARHYAFRNNYDGGLFGGGPMFGRF